MGVTIWKLYIEKKCSHGKIQPHGIGVENCAGGEKIYIGDMGMKEEAVEKWREASKGAG